MNFKEHGLELTAEQKAQFEKLLVLFQDWNSKINLSAIRDEPGIIEKHFVDSLLPLGTFDMQVDKMLDIGTGGGFPSLPLGIIYPEMSITSVDSVGKKLKAVQSMADDLGLNIKTLNDRIEVLGQDPAHRAQYDLVVARALAPWPVLLEYALPFVKVGGTFLAYQGPAVMEDLENFDFLEDRLGGEITNIAAFALGDAERIFVEITKVRPTPKKYPREVGVPKMDPLKIK